MSALGMSRQGVKYALVLSVDEESCHINNSQLDSTTVSVSGTGTVYSNDQTTAERYNNARHRTIYLEYTYEDDGTMYRALDSLVFVDADVTFEEFKINIEN